MQYILAIVLIVLGNSASAYGGNFPGGFQYYLGTNVEYGTAPGSLSAEFPSTCKELTIETGHFWELAKTLSVDAYKGGKLVQHIDTTPQANSVMVMTVKLFDSVTVANATPDPEGVNDLATMTIKNIMCRKDKP